MKFYMIFLALVTVSCRPGTEVIDKSTKKEAATDRPGANITIVASDASLICNDLSFYDPNGALIQGSRDCSESLAECSEDGDIDCRATATNPSVIKTELESKIIVGESLAGVEGAATEGDYTNCSAAGQIGCVTTSAFTAMDKSLADSATDLTSSNFNATIASAGNFEFWDATGARHLLSGDTNLTAINIKDGVSLFGIAGSLTGAPPNCASDGEGSCLVDGTNYRAAATAGAASKILSGQSVAGIAGNVTLPAQGTVLTGTNYGVSGTGSSGTLTLPSAANVLSTAGNYGNPSSQITPTYSPDFPDLANVRAGDTVNGANGTLADCSSDGGVGCVVVGPSYAAALTTGAADKILSGQSIAGVNGNVTLPAVGKVLTGTSFGVSGTGSAGTLTLPDAGDVLTGTGTYGDPGSAVTPSYSPDFPDLANVRSGDTVDGASGTLADCNAAGQASCVATATYATMDLSSKDAGGALDLNATDFTTRITSASLFEYWDENGVRFTANGDADILATNIKSTVDIFGVSGSVTEAPANCSSNGSQSCVATGSYYAATACASNGADTCYVNPAGSYDAADLSNLSAGNVKRGVTIAGTTGNFPSTTSPLPRYSDTGATTNTTGSDETDLTNFVTQLTSAGTFEYWDSSGVRRTGSGDADITDANVKSGVEFENLSITGNAAGAPCSYGAQGTCEADTACRWSGGACELNPWHIRNGITIGGQTGNIAFYKNMVDTSVFNRTSGTGALAGADVFDTIDDYNNNGSFPATAPGGWDQATGANWTEVVANDTYKDEITGLVWTDDRGSFTWENAISHCDGLTYGSRSDWRLPTQKELQQAYVNGIWSKKTELSLETNYYWSASSQSFYTAHAWIVNGLTCYGLNKTGTYRVVCVTP